MIELITNLEFERLGKMEVKEIYGINAFNLIGNGLIRVRDTFIHNIQLTINESEKVFILNLTNQFKNCEFNKVIIQCCEIIEIEFSHFENDPRYIEDFKIDYKNDIFYLSIDPDNSVREVIEADYNKVKFKKLYLTLYNE